MFSVVNATDHPSHTHTLRLLANFEKTWAAIYPAQPAQRKYLTPPKKAQRHFAMRQVLTLHHEPNKESSPNIWQPLKLSHPHTCTHAHTNTHTLKKLNHSSFFLSFFPYFPSVCASYIKSSNICLITRAHTHAHKLKRDQDSSDCKARARACNKTFLPTVLGFHVRNENTDMLSPSLSLIPSLSLCILQAFFFSKQAALKARLKNTAILELKYSFQNVLFLRPFHLSVQWQMETFAAPWWLGIWHLYSERL